MARPTSYAISPERIAELLVPFVGSQPLAESQLRAVHSYLDLLVKWNAKLNLTAIRNPEEIIQRHFGESLFAAMQIFPAVNVNSTAVDVGSGAGFPGLPLKIWRPELELTLVESNQRKAVFLREAVRSLQLNSVSVLAARAETISIRADVVTLRAVERFEHIVPIAGGLVKSGGRIAILIGEAQIASAQALLPGSTWERPIAIPLSSNRKLLIGQLNHL